MYILRERSFQAGRQIEIQRKFRTKCSEVIKQKNLKFDTIFYTIS